MVNIDMNEASNTQNADGQIEDKDGAEYDINPSLTRKEIANVKKKQIERELTINAYRAEAENAKRKDDAFRANLQARENRGDVNHEYLRGELSRYDLRTSTENKNFWETGSGFIRGEIQKRMQGVIDRNLNNGNYDTVRIPPNNGIFFGDVYRDKEKGADIYSSVNKIGGTSKKNKSWLSRQEKFKQEAEARGQKYEYNSNNARYAIRKNNDLWHVHLIEAKLQFTIDAGGIPREFDVGGLWAEIKENLACPKESNTDVYKSAWLDILNRQSDSKDLGLNGINNINDLMKKQTAIHYIGCITERLNQAWKIATEKSLGTAAAVRLAFTSANGINTLVAYTNGKLKTNFRLDSDKYIKLAGYEEVLSAISKDFCMDIFDYYDMMCRVPLLDSENESFALCKMTGRTLYIRWIMSNRGR